MRLDEQQHYRSLAISKVFIAALSVASAFFAVFIDFLALISGGVASTIRDPADYWVIGVALAIPVAGVCVALCIFSYPKLASCIAGTASIVATLFYGTSSTSALVVVPLASAAVLGTVLIVCGRGDTK